MEDKEQFLDWLYDHPGRTYAQFVDWFRPQGQDEVSVPPRRWGNTALSSFRSLES